jgi:hypothetical protein
MGKDVEVPSLAADAWMRPLWRMSIDWSFAEVNEEDGSGLFVWTAPEALRCGNRILLYEGGPKNRKAFIAVGRAVTDAVRAHRGDKRHWAWIEWLPLASTVSLDEIRRSTGYNHFAGSHVNVDESQFDLWSLVADDPAAAPMIEEWRRLNGFPSSDQVPIHQLFESRWRYRPQHEVAMYDVIRDALVDEGYVDAPEPLSALVRYMRGPTPSNPRGEQTRFPDVWLLDSGGSALWIIEVKKRARHRPGSDYDPVDQVINYVEVAQRTLAKSAFSTLRVRPMLVAHEIDAAERQHAAAAGVECRTLTKRGGHLRVV